MANRRTRKPASLTERIAGWLSAATIAILLYGLANFYLFMMPGVEAYNQKMQPPATLDDRLKMLESGQNTFDGKVYQVDDGLIIRKKGD